MSESDEVPPKTVTVSFAGAKTKVSRPAVLTPMAGRALLGETTFPVWAPAIYRGEKLRWTATGWVIEGAKLRKKAR